MVGVLAHEEAPSGGDAEAAYLVVAASDLACRRAAASLMNLQSVWVECASTVLARHQVCLKHTKHINCVRCCILTPVASQPEGKLSLHAIIFWVWLLVGKPEGKRPLGTPRRRWVDNIRMDPEEVGWGDVDWINLARGQVR
jgi:hypothetical protein